MSPEKFDYDDMLDTADELLSEFGFDVLEGKLKQVQAGTEIYDPSTTTVEYPVAFVVLNVKKDVDIAMRYSSVASDKLFRVIVGAKGLPVSVGIGDIVESSEGVEYKIIDIDRTKPYKIPLIYDCTSEEL